MNDAKTLQDGQAGETLPEAAALLKRLADILYSSDIYTGEGYVKIAPYRYGMIGDKAECLQAARRDAEDLANICETIQKLEMERRRSL